VELMTEAAGSPESGRQER